MKRTRTGIGAMAALALGLSTAACGGQEGDDAVAGMTANSPATTNDTPTTNDPTTAAPSTTPTDAGSGTTSSTEGGALSAEEAASLRFMREEEKLARDIYRALDQYGQVFVNIQESEQQHMDAILGLLDKYGLEDPSEGLPDGEFRDPTLQALYDQLLAQGSPSTQAALEVGALIEETDIRDIAAALEHITHPDIINVYEQLMRGSRNHLRAFVGALERMGVTYTPQILDPEELAGIVAGTTETGGGR